MIKKSFKDIKLSALGMGNMRLPTINSDPKSIDFEAAQALIDHAMAMGINYYDTAYIYHGGTSESFLGKALRKYPRDSYYLATKFHIDANSDYKATFKDQLERLGTDRIDFYLIHAVMDSNIDRYLSSGCIDYFLEQKRLGRISYLGFSTHAGVQSLRRMVDANDWDFAQIQMNYLDWLFSTTKEEYEIITSKNIPLIIMEPVRGGRLATLTDELNARLKAQNPSWSIASWAMRWLKRFDGIKVILSGMSNMEQLEDNIAVFSNEEGLSAKEEELLLSVAREYKRGFTIACTKCRYCCDECPAHLDIPYLLEILNDYKFIGWRMNSKILRISEKEQAKNCISCGACLKHCPQNIAINEHMLTLKEITERLK